MSVCLITSAQSNNTLPVNLRGYPATEYYRFFHSLHNQRKDLIRNTERSSFAFVILSILPSSKIADLEILEVPGLPIDSVSKKYIVDLFKATDGNWEFAEKTKIVTKIIFSVSLLKNSQSSDEKADAGAKVFEYSVMYISGEAHRRGIPISNDVPLTLVY
jgi:hypothetical protein